MNCNWKIDDVKPLNTMNHSWCSVYSCILQALQFCEMRGDNIGDVFKIVNDILMDQEKKVRKDARKTGFIPFSKIVDDNIILTNDAGEYEKIMIIISNK